MKYHILTSTNNNIMTKKGNDNSGTHSNNCEYISFEKSKEIRGWQPIKDTTREPPRDTPQDTPNKENTDK